MTRPTKIKQCPKCGTWNNVLKRDICRKCYGRVRGFPASTCSAWKAINDDALDGQMRILSDGERVMTGAWEETVWGGMAWFGEDSKILPMQPTMWMPMPNPPKQNPTDSNP